MKILHSADLHLDAPFAGRSDAQTTLLRQALERVPSQLADLCRRENCDLVLLAGDLFDGKWTRSSYQTLCTALEEMAVPVFISPGNHDFFSSESPYFTEKWPNNVHIFTRPEIESVALPDLDCRIYGAGYRSMDCPALLEGFQTQGEEAYHIGILHADPTVAGSPYCPMTSAQIRKSGLHYLALGHIHKSGQIKAGQTLCAWPGCPMGRGYDETDVKGAYIITLADTAKTAFIPLDTPRFFDLETTPGIDAHAALAAVLPAMADEHFYRITFVGQASQPDLEALRSDFAQFPHLELRDRTVPERDIWGTAGDDSLEGVYFRRLKEAMEAAEGEEREILTLAARISRQILDGQEVLLP